jgi:hypothetical protein
MIATKITCLYIGTGDTECGQVRGIAPAPGRRSSQGTGCTCLHQLAGLPRRRHGWPRPGAARRRRRPMLGELGLEHAEMRVCITVRVDPHREFHQPDGRGAVVTITTVSGTTVSCRVDHPRGHSLRGGATWPDLSDEWRDALADSDVASGSRSLRDSTTLKMSGGAARSVRPEGLTIPGAGNLIGHNREPMP